MKTYSLLCLAGLVVLVTGCPHNEYTVELIPKGKVLERKLEFFRADGTDTNGVPKYESFPAHELSAITALYPPGQVTRAGERHLAQGEFSGALPSDVGGAGAYRQFETSLGKAAFYVERFRGNDDLATRTKTILGAADQITDLIIGWARVELGREPGYKNLRRFLDGDFRRDVKNLALYFWAGDLAASYQETAREEFSLRFGQYLVEHGYLNAETAAALMQGLYGDIGSTLVSAGLQRFVAGKLGVPSSAPAPKALAFLADPTEMEKSWTNYLAGTRAYRDLVRQWQKDKQQKPDLNQPEPEAVLEAITSPLFDFGGVGGNDHLTVRLKLTAAPDHTNGQWDGARGQVTWESSFDSTNRLPVFCYASWSQPNAAFQQEHLGRVLLTGDELMQYCLWHEGLDAVQRTEWDHWLAALQPDGNLTNRVAVFQFSGGSKATTEATDFGKNLIKSALEHQP